jgi:hypothetical protein
MINHQMLFFHSCRHKKSKLLKDNSYCCIYNASAKIEMQPIKVIFLHPLTVLFIILPNR